MIAFPVGDARQRCIVAQTFKGKPHRERAQPQPLRRLGDSEKVHAAPADLAQIADRTLRKFADRSRSRSSAGLRRRIHGIELRMKWKLCFHEREFDSCNRPEGRIKEERLAF